MTISVMLNRRKKSVCYILCSGVLLYYVIQVVYFNQEYSPLQVLSDARSEARRLLRFITLYHYQCNNTFSVSNATNWPICTEIETGLNVESKTARRAYSVGPSEDLEFESALSRNLSFSLFILSHKRLMFEGFGNNTYFIKTIIVPNDPSDFTRNSYETQTLNDIMSNLHHNHLDILKIETLTEDSHSHETLYYMIKDDLLRKVDQLHIALHIDKVDDDYLYSWYRSLYNLFHISRFRLYHTSASNQLCLQITLMESCTYYMSWIKDPGPQTMVLYPPAIDGSSSFELVRFEDYIDRPVGYCDHSITLPLINNVPLTLCTYTARYKLSKPCKIFLIGEDKMQIELETYLQERDKCEIIGIQLKHRHIYSDVEEYTMNRKGLITQTTSSSFTLLEALDKYLLYDNKNIIYLSIPHLIWDFITQLLDSGVLKGVHQVILDVDLKKIMNLPANLIRRYYSELKRIEAYGFDLYQSEKLDFETLKLHQNIEIHRLNYIKTRRYLYKN